MKQKPGLDREIVGFEDLEGPPVSPQAIPTVWRGKALCSSAGPSPARMEGCHQNRPLRLDPHSGS